MTINIEISEYDEPLVLPLRIEHIGSTSVPGLAAKPIIDILVVVTDPGDEESYLPPSRTQVMD